MDPILVNDLLAESLITPKTKIEIFTATHLGMRPASQITIPAEFPSGILMGQEIDANVKPHMMQLQQIQDLRARAIAVQALKKLLEKNFETIVEESEEYKAYYSWSDRLGLKSNQVMVRPTVHEIYLFKEKKVAQSIRKLMHEREKIRRKVQRKPNKSVGSIRFAYPEEFEPKWLKGLGVVLGYPDCCIKQYADDRGNGINVEARAAKQLLDAVKEREVDAHVYYTGYFFPCTSHCEKALAKGHKWHETFNDLHSKLGELYEQTLYLNTETVLRQPELIYKYLAQFKPKKND